MTETKQRGGQRRRKYPSISLPEAIDRVKKLHVAEGRNPAPVDVVVQAWGYKNAQSGPASTTYSAVKQFGLIDEGGTGAKRVAAVSNNAYAILMAPDDLKLKYIREAALQPPIHRVVWKKYGANTGSDAAFRWYLIEELGFSERGSGEFIKQYRETMRFATLTQQAGDRVMRTSFNDDDTEEPPDDFEIPLTEVGSEDASDSSEDAPQGRAPEPIKWFGGSGQGSLNDYAHNPYFVPSGAHLSNVRRHAIPLIGGKQVILEGDFPLTEEAWQGFLAVLNAFKPGLVSDEGTTDD